MNIVNVTSSLEFVHSVTNDSADTIYRGVSNSEYGLRTSIGRNDDWCANQITDTETQYLEEFQQRAPLHLSRIPKTQLDWICLAQHFGLRTRLLDWTLNPLVALYFCTEKKHEREFAVYSYSGGETVFTSSEDDLNPFELFEVYRIYPNLNDQRYANQSSVFTIHPAPWDDFDNDDITKYVFQPEFAAEIRQILKRFQVNRAFIYPTLEQLSAQIMEDLDYRIRAYPNSGFGVVEFDEEPE